MHDHGAHQRYPWWRRRRKEITNGDAHAAADVLLDESYDRQARFGRSCSHDGRPLRVRNPDGPFAEASEPLDFMRSKIVPPHGGSKTPSALLQGCAEVSKKLRNAKARCRVEPEVRAVTAVTVSAWPAGESAVHRVARKKEHDAPELGGVGYRLPSRPAYEDVPLQSVTLIDALRPRTQRRLQEPAGRLTRPQLHE